MKLFNTPTGAVVETDQKWFTLEGEHWDTLVNREGLAAWLKGAIKGKVGSSFTPPSFLPPVASQEVWAAGVTYYRSRTARMAESKDTGGGTFYDRVYSAKRPELFFKAPGYRVVGTGAQVRIRKDSKWNVPEPELTLAINKRGKVFGYTIGNDMSSRDIEGANPLYLPQAKVYDGSCAIGPCILVTDSALPPETGIHISILRGKRVGFKGQTTLASLKRTPKELAEWLFRETSFPKGALLMTGTGVVPPDGFTLAAGDVINITIDGVGTLSNTVAAK